MGAKKQTTIDFGTRGKRLRLLDRVTLPKMPRTSPGAMLHVLRCIDSHARDKDKARVGANLIAEETNLSRRAVDRALSALAELYLIDIKRTGRTSIYTIGWGNLEAYDPRPIDEPTVDVMRHDDASESTPCRIRVDTMTHQMRHRDASTEATSETKLETHSQSPAWKEAAKAVAGVLSSWKQSIDFARAAGVDADYVLRCVDFYHRSGGAFAPGALFERLKNAADFHPPEELHTWPNPKPLSPSESKALELLARVRTWAKNNNQDDDAVRRTFTGAAAADGFTPAEVARALFESDLFQVEGELNR
jgi:DNA-binding transcriptional ArsR family regulator